MAPVRALQVGLTGLFGYSLLKAHLALRAADAERLGREGETA